MSQKRSRREYEADARRQQHPFVIYGTPLPPLDENTRDDGSYVPVWKQEVTDERGRKRLHGAFTGGFSAGYFNSVGSKEGWTPSTFVSSRTNRAKDAKNVQQQGVEDFMDDEDLREREESKHISATEGFAGFGDQTSVESRHALDDLFKPQTDSMGERLLNKMGWKKGQGIGPRIRRNIETKNGVVEVKEFPPEDSSMLEFNQKHDTRGLGIGTDLSNAEMKSSAHGSGPSDAASEDDSTGGFGFTKPPGKVKKPPKSSGIGVGSLNDTGSDDEDPYEMGPKVSYNRVIGGEKKSKKSKSSVNNANPLLKSKPIFVSKKLPAVLSTLRKGHDGKLPLAGFTFADLDDLNTFGAMSLSDEKYQPPRVPEDWQPKQLVNDVHSLDAIAVTTSMRPTQVLQNQTAQSRANILKEAPLPSKSVFDFLSPAARERLVVASGRSDLPPALGEAPPSPSNNNQQASAAQQPHLAYPDLDPTTALTALTRLRKDKDKPYADDLSKQGRYKDFLRFSSDPKPITERVPPLRAPNHKTDNEHLTELAEFATTANLFRPATGFFASRFTSAASSATSANAPTSATEGQDTEAQNPDNLLRRPGEKPKDPAEEAARMGMFGIATRSTIGFYPTKLLCKRFGVDLPTLD